MKFSQLLTAVLWSTAAAAQGQPAPLHNHGGSAPPYFVASSDRPYAALAGDAMAIMDQGMRRANTNGVPEHDFVTMMIPHHQGAIDMAKAFLVHSKDPGLRNLAQGIIVEQQNEIKIMQAWLQRYQASRSKPQKTSTEKDSHVHQ
jgi:uncharacterized protein (DUF305 family)